MIIDLGQERQVEAIIYLARQDGARNGTFADTEFYLSNDSNAFGLTSVAKAKLIEKRKPQTIELEEAVSARYLLVKDLSEINGTDYGSAAESSVRVK